MEMFSSNKHTDPLVSHPHFNCKTVRLYEVSPRFTVSQAQEGSFLVSAGAEGWGECGEAGIWKDLDGTLLGLPAHSCCS